MSILLFALGVIVGAGGMLTLIVLASRGDGDDI